MPIHVFHHVNECLALFSFQAYKAKERMREIFVRCLNRTRDDNNDLCSVLEEYRSTSSCEIDVQADEQFLDAIIELLFFGAETISSAGFSIIYNLTKNSQAFHKIQENVETNGLLDSHEDVYSHHDLQQMTYADAVVKETFRVLPPVGGAYRKVIEPFELEVGVK